MTAFLARSILWLVIGAVLSVLLASAAAWYTTVETVSSEPGDAADWFAAVHPEAMRQFEEVEWIDAHGFGRRVLLVGGWVHPRPGYREYLRHEAGWPWPALEATVEMVDRRVQTLEGGFMQDDGRIIAINEGRPLAETQRLLPWRPAWPGFVLNAAVFGVVGWLLSGGPLLIRRVLRIRRGACPRCGYDRRATTEKRCPECGAS